MCPNLEEAWKRLRKMEKLMSERIDTEKRMKKKFKEQDRYLVGLGCDNIKMDRTMRNVMSDLSRLKKLVKGLSSFPLPLGSQDKEPPAEPSVRLIPASYPNDPYVVTRDVVIAAAVATSGIDDDDDDDDTAPLDSQPYEPRGFPLFMDLMNRVCKPLLDKFMILFIDDILNYSKNKEEHLRIILELLPKEKLYAKFLKCEFWLDSVKFLGHVINSQGVHVDPTKVEVIKSWTALKSPTELTQKNKTYEWGKEEEEAFQLLKDKLCSAPILALPEGSKDFVVYCDASLKGYGAVLMQREK
nr:putative reverse transcriptase domain-containing protein [Tanacetum cinerariifolium]